MKTKHCRMMYYRGNQEGANNLNCYTFRDTLEDITYQWVTQSMKPILNDYEQGELLEVTFEVKHVIGNTVVIFNPSIEETERMI